LEVRLSIVIFPSPLAGKGWGEGANTVAMS
jgi:hypothetical protein